MPVGLAVAAGSSRTDCGACLGTRTTSVGVPSVLNRATSVGHCAAWDRLLVCGACNQAPPLSTLSTDCPPPAPYSTHTQTRSIAAYNTHVQHEGQHTTCKQHAARSIQHAYYTQHTQHPTPLRRAACDAMSSLSPLPARLWLCVGLSRGDPVAPTPRRRDPHVDVNRRHLQQRRGMHAQRATRCTRLPAITDEHTRRWQPCHKDPACSRRDGAHVSVAQPRGDE